MAEKTKENVHENHRQRLKDRFLKNPNSLNKHELLELLLFYSIPRKNVNPLAHKLLDKFGSVNAVLTADTNELLTVDGVGDNTAVYLSLLGKILDVTTEEDLENDLRIYNLESVKKYLFKFFASYDKEVFFAFFLSKTNKVIAKVSYTSDRVDEINFLLSEFSRSFANIKPHAVVVAHNHPSGNPSPSSKDDSSTEKMYLMFSLSGVKFYDHVIIAGNKLYSYSSDGRLDKIAKSINAKFDV
ncbi:MAG: RadC family protein [Clostridia bacterium]|nr:RadC family protein [Clostridia bacterium]